MVTKKIYIVKALIVWETMTVIYFFFLELIDVIVNVYEICVIVWQPDENKIHLRKLKRTQTKKRLTIKILQALNGIVHMKMYDA